MGYWMHEIQHGREKGDLSGLLKKYFHDVFFIGGQSAVLACT
jgi:hypothetical protein